MTGSAISPQQRTAAVVLLRALLEALPVGGRRDLALRRSIEQRVAALLDLDDFESSRRRRQSDAGAEGR